MKHMWLLLLLILPIGIRSAKAQRTNLKTPEAMRMFRLHLFERTLSEKIHWPTDSGSVKTPGEKPQSVVEHRISTSEPESEIHAAMNPTDTTNMVTGAMDLGTSLTFPIYYTTNFGSSWSRSTFRPAPYQMNAIVSGGGDPVFAYDADGKLYMAWIDLFTMGQPTDSAGWYLSTLSTDMYWASSTDGGKTFVRPANGYIGSGITKGAYNILTGQTRVDSTTGFDDKEWIAVDRSNSPYRNTLYVAWAHLSNPTGGQVAIWVSRKRPGVDSMEIPVAVTADSFIEVQYTSIAIDAKGGVHVTFMGTTDGSNFGIYTVSSSNGGKTFGPPIEISAAEIPGHSADALMDVIAGVRPPGNYPCDHIAIDTAKSGNLYAVWNAVGIDADQGHGTDIYFSNSSDNGNTWSYPTIINNDTVTNYTDHFYPSIAVDGTGMISVTWYDRREDPNNMIGRYYLAQSTDEGNTWTNMPVATQPMDFSQVMDVNGNFGIGEYTQVVAAPHSTVPFWCDGRDNHGQLRIYNAFVAPESAYVNQLSTVGNGMELLANYPNPATGITRLGFTVASSVHARLFLTNLLGQGLRTLFNGDVTPGTFNLEFDASQLSNGTYYLNLETDSGIATRAMTVLR